MTLIRRLASVVCWALLLTSYSASTNAQQVDSLTGNLINFTQTPTATTGTWQNVGQFGGTLQCWAPGQPGYCGPQPYVNANGQGVINFSYGQTDLYQTINIANAINAAAGSASGLQVRGFNFSFTAKNGNGWDNGQQDYLKAYVNFYGSNGSQVAAYDYSNQTNRKYNWTTFNFNETFTAPYEVQALQSARVGFVGRDTNGWAGPYGPEIYNVSFKLRYGVDPCVANPAYSPDCPGFKDVVTTNNLVPNPTGYAVYGDSINNSFAISKGLEAAGVGLMVHGFNWGYVANANSPYCAFWVLWCWDNRNPSVTTNVNITDNLGNSIYSSTRNYQNSYNTTNYSYLLPQSRPLNTLGNFNFTASTNDQAYVGSMWAKTIYTPDKCMVDPLSSPTCPGYAKALAVNNTSTGTTTTTSTATGTTDATATTTAGATTTLAPTSSTTSGSSTSGGADSTTASASPTTTTSSTSSSTTAPVTVSTTASTTSVTPSATNPQPKVGEVSVAGSQATSSKSTVSTSQILSIIGNEQSRLSKLETATASSAVEQAKADSAKVTADAQTVAATQQAQTLAAAQAVIASVTPSGPTASVSSVAGPQTSNFSVLLGPQTNNVASTNTNSVTSLGTGIVANTQQIASVAPSVRGPDIYSLTSFSNSTYTTYTPGINATPAVNYSLRIEREESKFTEQTISEQRSMFGATNPLTQSLTPLVLPPQPAPSNGPVVNKNVKDNEAAGGISLASIARQPQGFELYMAGMQDRPFYPEKEIYKGQRVVDNARAQRLLSGANDRLHQEMVDQQFKIGN